MKLSSSGVFFPLIYFHPLLLPPFTLNGDSGDRWREVLALLPPPAPPHPPLLSISPLPWCLFLNYISTLASTATLFTHCSIHIHLACTCLVPVRVTWRERTLKTYTCTTHTHTHTGSHTYAQALPWDREGVNERWRCQRGREKWGRREKMKISGRKKGERVKKNREIKWGEKDLLSLSVDIWQFSDDTASNYCLCHDKLHSSVVTCFRQHMFSKIDAQSCI